MIYLESRTSPRPRTVAAFARMRGWGARILANAATNVGLNHLGGEADDLHELALPQFAGDGPENARAARIQFVVDEHHRVAVEADVTAVVAAPRLAGPHDHALDDVAGLHIAARHRLLDAGDDDVAE